MNTKSKFKLFFILSLALVVAVSGCSSNNGSQDGSGEEYVSIATAGVGGVYYALGTGLASILSQELDGVSAIAESTAGSVENTRRQHDGAIPISFIQNSTVYFGYNGLDQFEDDGELDDIRAIRGGHANILHIIVPEDSDIQTLADLEGKDVAVGPPASATDIMSNALLEKYGLSRDDYNPQHLSFGEMVSAMQDNNIDVMFLAFGAPAAAAIEITSTRDVRFIPIEEDMMDAFLEDHFYWDAVEIPANVYNGQTESVPAIGATAGLYTHKDVSEDLIYDVIKTIYEKQEDFIAIHPAGEEWSLENAERGINIPFHKGAAKFLEENGIEVEVID